MVDLAYVIPAFNAAQTVGATVRSVLAQRGVSVCAIVVDDGSTDGTGDVARAERDWRIEVVRQANRGLAAARNTGLEVLEDRAEAVCFLDADDTVEAGHAQTLIAGLRAEAGAQGRPHDVVACGYRMVGAELEDLGWTIEVAEAAARLERLIEFNPMAVGAVALRVEGLRAMAGREPFRGSHPGHEDWDLWLRLTGAGAAWGPPIPTPLFCYRMRPNSMSRHVAAMWRSGLTLIAESATDENLRRGALRRWTIRSLARASVCGGDGAAIAEMLAVLRAGEGRDMDAADRVAFAGALRHGCLVQHAVGPAGASEHEASWRAAARAALAAWPECHGAIESLSFSSWEGVAERLERLLGRDGRGDRGRLAHLRPVIAGMGRNGRVLAAALATRGIPFDWVDEDASATCPVAAARRLGMSQVAPRHLVIVTPTLAEGLVERLRETRALVMRPFELVEHGHEIERRRVA